MENRISIYTHEPRPAAYCKIDSSGSTCWLQLEIAQEFKPPESSLYIRYPVAFTLFGTFPELYAFAHSLRDAINKALDEHTEIRVNAALTTPEKATGEKRDE